MRATDAISKLAKKWSCGINLSIKYNCNMFIMNGSYKVVA